MKPIFIAFLIVFSGNAISDTYVRGYIKKDGTYVQPHMRSNHDGNSYNNYSTQGNVNPYTGQSGTVNPYQQPYQYTPPQAYTPPPAYQYNYSDPYQ